MGGGRNSPVMTAVTVTKAWWNSQKQQVEEPVWLDKEMLDLPVLANDLFLLERPVTRNEHRSQRR